MTKENIEKFNAMIRRINGMDGETLNKLIEKDQCPYEPEHLIGVPLGMFHCEVCGEMVIAGVPHGRNFNDFK